MSVLIDDLIISLEKKFPPNLSAEWDRSGWQYKGNNENTKSIIICLDVTKRSVETAKKNQANLILSHHPIMFNMPDFLDYRLYPASALTESIGSNINIYSLHTNIDAASGGMNDYLAVLFGMKKIEIPQVSGCSDKDLSFSRIGIIQPVGFDEIIQRCCKIFDIHSLKLVGSSSSIIKRLLVVSGSGSSIIRKLDPKSFDLAITGDLKYHDALFFRENGYCVLDIGHFIEQKLFTEIIQNYLEEIYGNRLLYIKSIEENCLKGVGSESNN